MQGLSQNPDQINLNLQTGRVFLRFTAPFLSFGALLSLTMIIVLGVWLFQQITVVREQSELSDELVTVNLRVLSQVQRENLRLQILLESGENDPVTLDLQRSFLSQRLNEAVLPRTQITYGSADLLGDSKKLKLNWEKEIEPFVLEIIADPNDDDVEVRQETLLALSELELGYNRLVTQSEWNRRQKASKNSETTHAILVRMEQLFYATSLSGILLLFLLAAFGLLFYWYEKKRIQNTQQLLQMYHDIRKLSHVAQHTSNLVIITDSIGNIEWVNESFTHVTGYTRDEVVGQRPGNFLQGPKSDESVVQYMRKQLCVEKKFQTELINYNKSGEEYWIEIEVQPVFDDQKKLVNFIAIESDITLRKQSELQLKMYAQELERSNRELQDFAYAASHDLQEPLRKIQAFGSRLSNRYADNLDEKGLDYLQRMLNAAERMQGLILALLDFSRVTTKPEPFTATDLNKVIQGVLEDLEVKIEETNTQFEIDHLPTIDSDRMQMRQLFQNLIGNALKFVKDDTLPKIKVTSLEKPNNTVEISVSDNGIGLDEKYADRIFSVFQRLHGKQEYSGTGVGLAICRKIVSRHNGSIAVQSKIGQGATFVVKLPLYQSSTNKLSTQEFPHVE